MAIICLRTALLGGEGTDHPAEIRPHSYLSPDGGTVLVNETRRESKIGIIDFIIT